MIKRTAAVLVAVCLSVCTLSGCGNQIKGRTIKFVDPPQKEITVTQSQSQAPKTDDSSFADNYPDPAKDINDMRTDNLDFYKQRIVVAGDSIAAGWSLFQVLPKEQSIAQGGISTAGYSRWEYDTTGQKLSMLDTMKAVRPSLLYISLGMNDVGNIDSDTYASQYKELLDSILEVVPDCYIVAANITPIARNNEYPQLSNSEINVFNNKLRQMIKDYGKDNVIYFDVNSSMQDANEFLNSDYDSGDGLHINTEAYNRILVDVTKRLNYSKAQEKIEAVESARKSQQQ